MGFVDFPADFRGDGYNYSASFNLYEDQGGNWSYEQFENIFYIDGECTIQPTATTQIIQTKYRCIEFPIDMFSDSSYSFLNSFGATNKLELQATVIKATVDFYETNYIRSNEKLPALSFKNVSDKQIYFQLGELPDCTRCDGTPYITYEFKQNSNGTWEYFFVPILS